MSLNSLYIGLCNLPNENKVLSSIKLKKLNIRLKSQDNNKEESRDNQNNDFFARLWSKYTALVDKLYLIMDK